jgi:hypothetical protein
MKDLIIFLWFDFQIMYLTAVSLSCGANAEIDQTTHFGYCFLSIWDFFLYAWIQVSNLKGNGKFDRLDLSSV